MDETFNTILASRNAAIDEATVKGLVRDIRTDNEETVTGNESFEFLDKAFYKIDKAFENSIKGVMGYFQTTNIFIDDLIDYRTKTPAVTTLYKLKPGYVKNMNKVKFYNVENVKAPVILGMNIKYSELLDILNSNVSYLKGMDDTMARFDTFLTDLIESNKDSINVNKDMAEVKAIKDNSDMINKSMDSVTNNKMLNDRVKLGKLTKDFRELKETVDETLKAGVNYRMENLEKLYDVNEEINSKLDVLYNAIKGKKVEISKSDIMYISEYIGSVARMLTAVAFLFYLYYQLVDMLVAALKIVDTDNEDASVIVSVANTISDGWTLLKNAFK